ncbi:uncharacterized protein LTR77_006394 [Saxophila tyrrhenica]|uniref:NAD(P)-binding protein n=1 Tax=Saxophila tyrrhenica TaxID=1690608 RepID=A0AAV9PBX9_9PEZI|nr:hypothetical protein LTR77_006394 [Saxophila tyrrhenica]
MSQDPKSKLSSSGQDFTKTIHHDTYDFIKPEQWDLKGKAVLVTGASKGVGRAAAISFAKAGASYIALGARSSLSETERAVQDEAKQAGRQPPTVLSLTLDVASESSVAQAAKDLEASFGRLDILCNNAGYLENFAKVAESDPTDWWRVYEINVKGVYLCARAFIPLLLKSKDGLKTVLNTSSVGAHVVMPGASGYQTGKLAVVRFGEFLMAEYGEQGLLSYAIHPGGVATELALGMPKDYHALLGDKPELAGDAMVWLTGERREWLGGRFVDVTWDMEEFLGKKGRVVEGGLLKVRLDVGLE